MKQSDAPDPVMIRVYKGDKKGATSFFRNRPFLETVCAQLKTIEKPQINVLFHACSVGAEPYSFVAAAAMSGLFGHFEQINIIATDIEADFIAQAKAALYPASVVQGLTPAEQAFFAPADGGNVTIHPLLKEAVQFIAPASFVDFSTDVAFDAVFVMNAMTYVTPAQQSEAIRKIAGYNSRFLMLSAFHPDGIKADLQQAGYAPVAERRGEIHNAWGDRVTSGPIAPQESSWRVPPYSEEVADFEYKFGAIFQKTR